MSCTHSLKNNFQNSKEDWLRLVTFDLSITNHCNLDCIHCLRDRKEGELSLKDSKKIFHEIKNDFTNREILFTGGELFLHSDIQELFRSARDNDLRINIVTNAFSITENDLLFLKEKDVNVVFSLDGREVNHNFQRRNNLSFQRVQNAIKVCNKIALDFSIISSIGKNNLSDIEWLVEFAVMNNARSIRVQPITPVGAALKMKQDDELLSGLDLDFLYNTLIDLSLKYLGDIKIGSLGQFKKKIVEHGCKLGLHFGSGCHSNQPPWPFSFAIKANGDVLPFSSEINPFFTIGNVREDSLINMVNNFYASSLHIEFLSRLKAYFSTIEKSHGEIFNLETFVLAALQ